MMSINAVLVTLFKTLLSIALAQLHGHGGCFANCRSYKSSKKINLFIQLIIFHRPINTIWILCLRASVLFCWNNQLEEQWSATIANYLAINVEKLLNFFYKESTKNHKTFGYGKYQRLVSIKCEHKVYFTKNQIDETWCYSADFCIQNALKLNNDRTLKQTNFLLGVSKALASGQYNV